LIAEKIMQKGDLVDYQGRLVRVVSIVDEDDVLVATGGYGSNPVLVHRKDLGKKVFRPYGTGFEGEFTQTMNDNKGLVLAVIGAGAVLTGILLYAKPAAVAPPPPPAPLPPPMPAPTPPAPPPSPSPPPPSPAPAKAPAPVPRTAAAHPPKAPPPPKAPASPTSPVPGLPNFTDFVPIAQSLSAIGASNPAGLPSALSAVTQTLGGSLPASMGTKIPVANIPGAGSLPAPMSSMESGGMQAPESGGVIGVLESLNPFA
jgi:hypothetical protein